MKDCQSDSKNDQNWALVELLDMRAGMNARGLFSGDIAMRMILKQNCGQ